MQNKFKKKKPNTISRAVYYAASGLRATVAAGDREYKNIHKVYTVWLCDEDVVFRNGMDTAFIYKKESTSSPDVDPDVSIAITNSRIRFTSLYSSGSISGIFPYSCRPYV